MFFDRIRYTATQVSDTVFDVTLDPNYEALPEAATRASLYVKDTAGNQAHIDGYRVAGQIIVNFIHNSTETDDTMPTFGVGLEIYGTVGAAILNNMLGRGLILQIGQSNGVGWAENSVGLLDWTDGRILQIDSSGNTILAVDSLDHPDNNPTRPANSTGMAMTFAKDVLRNEYHNQIVIIPHCEGSTGFWEGQWVKGGYLYDGALAKMNAFLAENPNNYIIAILWNLGEDDATDMTRANAFQASFDLATTNLRADVVGNYRQPDASRVPVICTQMSPDWNINTSIPIVRAALADLPNRLPYTGHVDSAGATSLPSDFNIHFDGPGLRLMGSRIYPQLVAARGNTNPVPGETLALDSGSYALTGSDVDLVTPESLALDSGSYALTGSDVTFSVGMPFILPLDAGSYSLTGTDVALVAAYTEALDSGSYALTGSDVTFSQGYSMAAESGTYTLTGSDVDLTFTAPIQTEFRRGVGQTTGATVTWANQGALGSSHDAVQSTAANQPTFDGSGNVVFDGTDDFLSLPGDVLANSDGYSIMVRFQRNGNFQSLVGSDSLVDAVARLYLITNPLTATSNDSPLLNGSTTITNNTWFKAYITVDASNTQTLYVNGVQDAQTTGGTKGTGYTETFVGAQEGVVWPLNGKISDLIIQPAVMSLADMDAATASWGT